MINDDVFARLVSEEVKNKISSVQKQILLEPENWHRWKDGLLLLIENLEIQIEGIKDDADADICQWAEAVKDLPLKRLVNISTE